MGKKNKDKGEKVLVMEVRGENYLSCKGHIRYKDKDGWAIGYEGGEVFLPVSVGFRDLEGKRFLRVREGDQIALAWDEVGGGGIAKEVVDLFHQNRTAPEMLNAIQDEKGIKDWLLFGVLGVVLISLLLTYSLRGDVGKLKKGISAIQKTEQVGTPVPGINGVTK